MIQTKHSLRLTQCSTNLAYSLALTQCALNFSYINYQYATKEQMRQLVYSAHRVDVCVDYARDYAGKETGARRWEGMGARPARNILWSTTTILSLLLFPPGK